ncbi:MAG: hypothetical protein JOS17DRAFT_774450 [Linnemannia elongata]|nr:MAG: hypothetical protein JOS17DRAFT_774450 [Linnemannia elongata]
MQDCTDKPCEEYMERVRNLSAKDMPSSFVDVEEVMDNCRRYEVTKRVSQFVRQQTSYSAADDKIFKQCIGEAERKFDAFKAGVPYVEDPNVVAPKGRPRSKRLKSQAEIASERASKKFKGRDSELNVEY